MSRQTDVAILQEKLRLLELQKKIEDGLPHLHSFKWYKWARTVFESTNPEIFLVAANQLSKSSTAIRKNIHWATAPDLWPKLWPGLIKGQKPNLFWYFYPNLDTATTEFLTKWQDIFLPKNEFKKHPIYGWQEEWEKGFIHSIIFNSGVTIRFKTYSMKSENLQASSVYHITCDEELPVDHLPEIKARLNATDGFLLNVFTATLGQHHWLLTMEPPTPADEKHKDALKLQISLYDSMVYEDGSPSPWTKEKIERAKANCPTEAEVQRRVYGRFVKSQGLKIESFDLDRNMTDAHPLPQSWLNYGAVDPGSGGQSGHPSAMVFLSVSPDYKQGRVFRGWRGDSIATAASDTLDKYRSLRGNLPMVSQGYDWASKDFFTYASRLGESFMPAEKGRDAGFGLLNTLFKNGMLKIHRGDPELDKLVQEISSLPVEYDKRKTLDDMTDALRYACMLVPWDFSDVDGSTNIQESLAREKAPKKEKTELELRREFTLGLDQKSDEMDIDEEFDIWNELSGASE